MRIVDDWCLYSEEELRLSGLDEFKICGRQLIEISNRNLVYRIYQKYPFDICSSSLLRGNQTECVENLETLALANQWSMIIYSLLSSVDQTYNRTLMHAAWISIGNVVAVVLGLIHELIKFVSATLTTRKAKYRAIINISNHTKQQQATDHTKCRFKKKRKKINRTHTRIIVIYFTVEFTHYSIEKYLFSFTHTRSHCIEAYEECVACNITNQS